MSRFKSAGVSSSPERLRNSGKTALRSLPRLVAFANANTGAPVQLGFRCDAAEEAETLAGTAAGAEAAGVARL